MAALCRVSYTVRLTARDIVIRAEVMMMLSEKNETAVAAAGAENNAASSVTSLPATLRLPTAGVRI